MALKSPTVGHGNWGKFSTAAYLPNAAGASIQTAGLEVGDTAHVADTNALYQCTLATIGAATWVSMLSVPTAVHDDVAGEIVGVTLKGTPTTSDIVLLEDVADSDNKKSAIIGSFPTGQDADAIHSDVAAEISAVVAKTSPIAADLLLIEDSEAADVKKSIQIGDRPFLAESSNLWQRPDTAHADDEEFDVDTISAAWEVWNYQDTVAGSLSSGTIAAYDVGFTSGNVVRANQHSAGRHSWLLFQPPATSKTMLICKPVTLATNVLVMARLRFSQRYTFDQDHNAALVLCQSVSSRIDYDNSLNMSLSGPTAAFTEYASYNKRIGGSIVFSQSTTDVSAQGQALEYVAIHKIGTTYHGWVGTAAGNWIYMGSTAFAGTVAYAGVLTRNVSSIPLIGGIDFIRFLETDNFLF